MSDKMLKENNRTREHYIDFLKGTAMLFVMLVHINNVWPSPISLFSKVAAIGARCPQLFLIISSFLIWKSFSRSQISTREFYKKQWIRLAPLFYTAMICSMFIPTVKIGTISMSNILSHVLFINGFHPYWINSIIGIEWYIADLAIFYMICPMLKKIAKDLQSSFLCFFVSATISCITLFLYNVLGGSSVSEIRMFFETFFFLHQLPVLFLGIILFYIIQKIEQKKMNIWKVRSICLWSGLLMIAVAAFLAFFFHKWIITSSLIAGLIFAWTLLFAYTVKDLWKAKIFKPILTVGRHCYGIYCFHQIIINCLILLPLPREKFSLWILMFLMTWLVSFIVGFTAEKIQIRLFVLKGFHL